MLMRSLTSFQRRDDLEDQELDAVQFTEGMPTTITGFKDHPLYV
jgi:xeroderma pigmentosum group C-complementing protein